VFLPFKPYSKTVVLESYRATVLNIVSHCTKCISRSNGTKPEKKIYYHKPVKANTKKNIPNPKNLPQPQTTQTYLLRANTTKTTQKPSNTIITAHLNQPPKNPNLPPQATPS
jgi:hypothetical protein